MNHQSTRPIIRGAALAAAILALAFSIHFVAPRRTLPLAVYRDGGADYACGTIAEEWHCARIGDAR